MGASDQPMEAWTPHGTVHRDTQGRDKTVCKGTGNGGIKGNGNPSPAYVLVDTPMDAWIPPGRTAQVNLPCTLGNTMAPSPAPINLLKRSRFSHFRRRSGMRA